MPQTRRSFLRSGFAAGAVCAGAVAADSSGPSATSKPNPGKRPVIDVTDLYHPHQDRGDNIDLITAYALPQVDLRAVIFDVTDRYRWPYHNPADPSYDDPTGPREPGFVPVAQLNYLFDRDVPCAPAPFTPMRGPEDTMTGAPRYQQRGIELMLDTLRRAQAPVDIVSFGSARPVAVAYNRAPDLLRERVRRVHLCAGAAPAGYLEWNVQLDVHAFVRLLRADLPLAVYPCATDKGAFDLGPHNTYWSLPNLAFVRDMAPPLQRYIEYAFLRSNRHDFLTVLDSPDPLGDMTPHYAGTHHLWETAVWTQVAGLRVAHVAAASPPLTGERGEDAASTKGWRILPKMGAPDGALTVEEQLLPCRFEVRPDGQFRWEGLADSQHAVYSRANPTHYEQALREALPTWYRGFSGLLATG